MPSIEDDKASETDKALDAAGTDNESDSDSSDPGEESESQHFMPQQEVEPKLEQVVKLLRDDKSRWGDIAEVDKRALVGTTTHPSGPTALHILADEKPTGENNSVLKDLVEYLVKSDQNMLLQVNDNSGYTPLHLAIYWRNRSMIKWICAACDNIDPVLRIKGTKLKRNCIHLAIECAKSGKDKTARMLVDLASAETLAEKDEEGNTPLSLAVKYNRCKEGQIKLIETIVARSDYFVRELPDHDFNNAHQSPYMYHLATADTGGPRIASQEPVEMAEQQQRRTEPGSQPRPRRSNTGAPMAYALPSRPGDAMGNSKAGLVTQSKDRPDRVQFLDSGTSSKTTSDAYAGHADEIREFLKKHYLRSRDQDAALEILYGRNPSSG